MKVNIANLSLHKWQFPSLFLGVILGGVVSFDPYLTNIIVKQVDVSVSRQNVFDLFPYELSALVAVFLLTLFFGRRIFEGIISHPDRSFQVFFLIGLQTIALTSIGRIDFSEFLLLFYATVLIARAMVRQEKIIVTGFDLLNILFVMFVLLSSVVGGIVVFLSSSMTMVKFLLIGFLIVNTLKNMDDLKFFLKALVVITLVSALIAIVQEVIYLAFRVPVIGFVDKSNLKFLFEETVFGKILRVPAFFGTYKPFTFFLNTSMMILLNYYLYNRPLKRKWMIFGALSFCVLFAALLLTLSNDGFLAFLIGVCLSFLIWRPYLVFHFVAFAIAGVIIITGFGLWEDIGNTISAQIQWGEQRIRLQLAMEGISGFIHKHPWFGAGIQQAERYTGHYLGWPAHNSFIEGADEVGIFGLLAYLGLLFYTFLNLIRMNVMKQGKSEQWLTRGLLLGFITFMIVLQFHPFFAEKFAWLLMGTIQAVGLIAGRVGEASSGNSCDYQK